MIDPVQAVLLVVIGLLAIILIILGIQVFFVLKELRKTLETINKETLPKLNNAADGLEVLSNTVMNPLGIISGIVESTRSLAPILKIFTSKNKDEQKNE